MLKDPVVHSRAKFIYKCTCSCREFYVGEMKWNTEVRQREDCSAKKMSEVGDHLLMNPAHTVN